jgi:hypothetical protein
MEGSLLPMLVWMWILVGAPIVFGLITGMGAGRLR